MIYLLGTRKEEHEHFIVFQKLNEAGRPHGDAVFTKQFTVEKVRFHTNHLGHLLVETDQNIEEVLYPKKKE